MRPSELAKLLIREALHGPRHRQGQRPIPLIEKIHRSLIAIRITAGGGHPLQGFERQLAQLGGLDLAKSCLLSLELGDGCGALHSLAR